jgi:16S rRNA (cytosine967-C5)-methyltransferase
MKKNYRSHKSNNGDKQLSDASHIPYQANLRVDAAWVLFQILENGVSASELMPKVWDRQINPKDRAWLQEVIYGVLRNLPKLQLWLRQLLNSPLKKQQKIIEHLIMVGLYQLAFTRTADHAAISETVEACKKMDEVGLSGLVNAVLRRFQREEIQEQVIEQAHVNAGLPKWLFKAIHTHYAEQAQGITENLQKRASLWLRVNTQKISAQSYADSLQSNNYDFESFTNNAIKIEKAGEITQLPGYDDGHFAIQDYAAQQAALLLAPKAGDVVLDCCAAPGGKTAGLLEYQPDMAALYAIDLVPKRVQRIHENLARLGHDVVFGDKIQVLTQDASTLSSSNDLPMFDKILLDAPCSATGVIRRHPDIMWLRKMADIDVLVALQASILEQAWQKLKPGGTLLYATCSILPQENSQQIKAFLAQHNDAKLEKITTLEGQQVDYWQILPGQSDMDGFFYARLIKC